MTIKFNNVYVENVSTVAGPFVIEGPLKDNFDKKFNDFYDGEKTFEKCEMKELKESIKILLDKTKYNEDDIYNTFGETNGDILFCYASLKNLIVEDELDYSYGDSKDLYSEALFFSEIRDIPIMDKNVTNNYIANFQKYKKLYEESKNPEEKAIYERKYIFYQNQVIEGNIRLIISIANKKTRYGLELNELINEGTFGMIKAMERFDASLGFAFSTYATCWLRQSISRAIEEKGRTIRIPSAQYQVYNKYLTAVKTLSLKLNREPSLEELADYLEMDLKKLTHLVVSFSENPSLDATPKDENEKDQENAGRISRRDHGRSGVDPCVCGGGENLYDYRSR